jgi:hypothetical protein
MPQSLEPLDFGLNDSANVQMMAAVRSRKQKTKSVSSTWEFDEN